MNIYFFLVYFLQRGNNYPTMQDSLLFILLALVAIVIYLIIKQNKNKDEVVDNKEAEEMANLKTEITSLKDTLNTTINTSLGSMSTSFNNLSTG